MMRVMPLPLRLHVADLVVELTAGTNTIIVAPSTPELLRERLADHGIRSSVVADVVVLVPDEGGPCVTAVTGLCMGQAHVALHWRQDVHALDHLRVPDALLLRRVTANPLPIAELVLTRPAIAEIERATPNASPPTGAPRWLAGMAWEARHRQRLVRDAIERSPHSTR